MDESKVAREVLWEDSGVFGTKQGRELEIVGMGVQMVEYEGLAVGRWYSEEMLTDIFVLLSDKLGKGKGKGKLKFSEIVKSRLRFRWYSRTVSLCLIFVYGLVSPVLRGISDHI